MTDLGKTTGCACFFDNVSSKVLVVMSGAELALQVTNRDTTLIEQPPQAALEPPELKGYLNKYANVAKGYSTRWFVLKDGVLSCERTATRR